MKTGILYMTKHGTTEKVANMIRSGHNCPENVELIDLKSAKNPDISLYETVIIGGSIHAGTIQQGVKRFCQKDMDILLKKRVGIYLCCMEEGDKAIMQFENAFPVDLRKHAICKEIMGGEFFLEKMNFFEKAIVKKVSGFSESVSRIDMNAVDQFAADIYTN